LLLDLALPPPLVVSVFLSDAAREIVAPRLAACRVGGADLILATNRVVVSGRDRDAPHLASASVSSRRHEALTCFPRVCKRPRVVLLMILSTKGPRRRTATEDSAVDDDLEQLWCLLKVVVAVELECAIKLPAIVTIHLDAAIE